MKQGLMLVTLARILAVRVEFSMKIFLPTALLSIPDTVSLHREWFGELRQNGLSGGKINKLDISELLRCLP